jgi:excisionase family DNA binding protein
MNGWAKVKEAARYAGVSERTLRDWLQEDLRHARLPSGRILIRLADIDGYLDRFCGSENRADKIVDELLREVRK